MSTCISTCLKNCQIPQENVSSANQAKCSQQIGKVAHFGLARASTNRTKKLIVSSCAKQTTKISTVPWLPDIHSIFLDQWSHFCFFAGKCVVLIFCFPCIVKLAFSTIAARQAADAIGTLTHDICLVIFASSNRDEAIMSCPCVCVCVSTVQLGNSTSITLAHTDTRKYTAK